MEKIEEYTNLKKVLIPYMIDLGSEEVVNLVNQYVSCNSDKKKQILKEKGHLIKKAYLPRLDYLPVIDEVYFK